VRGVDRGTLQVARTSPDGATRARR
jgi:hypothetical protein